MSRANTHARRSQWKTTAATLTTCPRCHAPKQPHLACPACGAYGERTYERAIRSEHEQA